MNEVICPRCQGVNVATALVCRYCHASLGKTHPFPSNPKNTSRDNLPSSPTTPENQEDEAIPEWLRRVRELKKADEEKERERERWRQQSFLTPESNASKKSKTTPSETKNKTSKKIHSPSIDVESAKSQKLVKETSSPALETEGKSNKSNREDPSDENDNLPEGFTPLGN